MDDCLLWSCGGGELPLTNILYLLNALISPFNAHHDCLDYRYVFVKLKDFPLQARKCSLGTHLLDGFKILDPMMLRDFILIPLCLQVSDKAIYLYWLFRVGGFISWILVDLLDFNSCCSLGWRRVPPMRDCRPQSSIAADMHRLGWWRQAH